ncbi:MAG: zinc-binding alcohol dehydrogenase family protein [Acidobacteriota bacterium]
MKAVVIDAPGGPEVLRLVTRPVPAARPGWVRIRVRAFGLNRSELFTRQGHSPSVSFPRILGIEAVGEVVDAPDGAFTPGQTVATAMGGMGRAFDGGYAEYTCVPVGQVQAVETRLSWEALAALPEMLQTAWGSLHTALQLAAGQTLLIRGGTTSVGLAAAALARAHGATVLATTRRPERADGLRAQGADRVFIDDGAIAEAVLDAYPHGVDRVLELVGTATLLDSLQTAAHHGIVCMTGIVGNRWDLERFVPMEMIPSAVYLTSYGGDVDDFMRTPLNDLIARIEQGTLSIRTGPVFDLDAIVEAHRTMEANRAGGKIVVRVP